jgi:hypothetical protein
MRATIVVLAAVLGSIVAGTGCCKTCDWCNWGGKSAEKPAPVSAGPPPVVVAPDMPPPGAVTLPAAPPAKPAAPAPAGTGTYGGTGN